MEKLREKSLLLTGYLEHLLKTELPHDVEILTPSDTNRRGAQLSISVAQGVDKVMAALQAADTICDSRKPHVIRVAPAPLYNSFVDVYKFVLILKSVLRPEP